MPELYAQPSHNYLRRVTAYDSDCFNLMYVLVRRVMAIFSRDWKHDSDLYNTY